RPLRGHELRSARRGPGSARAWARGAARGVLTPCPPLRKRGEGELEISVDAPTRRRASSPPARAAQARAHPRGERAARARRREDAALPAGILRPGDVRLDAGGDARALGVERGGTGAV